MEGDKKGGERSPRDPERKSPTQNKNSRRESSAESPSTYVSARVQKVTIYYPWALKYLSLYLPSTSIRANDMQHIIILIYAAYNMRHFQQNSLLSQRLWSTMLLSKAKVLEKSRTLSVQNFD